MAPIEEKQQAETTTTTSTTTTTTTTTAETTTTTTASSTTTSSITTVSETTTTSSVTSTTTPETQQKPVYGDANCDDIIDMSDAVLIMQSLANPNKYGVNGSDSKHITDKGLANADVDVSSKGLTTNDALRIQEYLLHKITSLEPAVDEPYACD
jgi:hypothetical protein